MVMRVWIVAIFMVSYYGILQGQDSTAYSPEKILYKVEENGDTIFYATIDEVYIFPKHTTFTRAERRRYDKLVYNVKKVYPYAKMAGAEYRDVTEHMLALQTDKERRVYIKEVEDRIMSNYEDDLKKLTITQGRILLKLVDREIGETSYDILKDLKGTITAVFWQAIARIFGNNLKSEFDPNGEDKLLNEIVIQIENGQL
jgi:hypothetical protein